jgi:hypothetical protein
MLFIYEKEFNACLFTCFIFIYEFIDKNNIDKFLFYAIGTLEK